MAVHVRAAVSLLVEVKNHPLGEKSLSVLSPPAMRSKQAYPRTSPTIAAACAVDHPCGSHRYEVGHEVGHEVEMHLMRSERIRCVARKQLICMTPPAGAADGAEIAV